jgi:ubiquinone/menaquinone biosynthesis C-methylase UbiE
VKVRDSGMPAENIWSGFFNVDLIFTELQISSNIRDLVEIGCGYGTFTIPSARIIKGIVYTFDIELEMLESVKQKLAKEDIHNVNLEQRDVLTQKTGLADNSIDYVMLFNILQNDNPMDFLNEAFRVLKTGGKVGILHWRSDIITPRGPDLSIRPKPEQILKWIDHQKFSTYKEPTVIKPFHFGLVLSKL